MSLDRHQQIARIWDWLPAFRAAAEYESLQRAGLALAVSPSALSRSIKLLEETLGVTLFTRRPTGLSLTPHGERLLEATREAMRRVHDALPTAAPNRLRAGAIGPVLPLLLGEAAIEAFSDWPLALTQFELEEAGDRLHRGEVDVLLAHGPLEGVGLSVAALPHLEVLLAAPPGASEDRVACLTADELGWHDPHATVSNPHQLISLVTTLRISAVLPRWLVPAGWKVIKAQAPLPVFIVTRVYSEEPPFVRLLKQVLTRRLAAQ
ncbi:MAG: LysR family transcriptional regulator [Archangium sp.]|nr:LysR family transcriptional regulator [Archangium sp.]MDP3573449.1 LysR family transcriptional regulator [Archangium sp.]